MYLKIDQYTYLILSTGFHHWQIKLSEPTRLLPFVVTIGDGTDAVEAPWY